VLNGASDLYVQVFGPERGRHTRAAVSISGLAFNAPVEADLTVQVQT
jgi:hypothetical protein